MKRIIRYFYYLAALSFSKIVGIIPYKSAVWLGGRIGYLAYYVAREARRVTEKNLEVAFPEKNPDEIRTIARQVFVNQGKNTFELFSFPKLSKERILKIVKIENESELRKPIDSGAGIIMPSAHCGNWEIMGASFAALGLPVNVVARKIYIDGLNSMLVGFRESKGMKVVLRSEKNAAKLMLKALRNREIIALLIDQDTAVPGVFVDFFSKKAWTPSAVASLALRTGASIVLALDVRMPDDTHKAIIKPVELRRSGDTEKDIAENTQAITAQIEEHIRRYPEQWVWMHERWKTRPDDKNIQGSKFKIQN